MNKQLIKSIYRPIRAVCLTLVCLVIGLGIFAYIGLSLPIVRNLIKEKAEQEATAFLGGKVEVGDLEIFPFNSVQLKDVRIYTPEGQECIGIKEVGAGIELYKLIRHGRIVISYASVGGLDATVIQKDKDGPLNIDFIIKAFEQNRQKPPKDFDVSLKNITIRQSAARFLRPYLKNSGRSSLSKIEVRNLSADLRLPVITPEKTDLDLRRLALDLYDANGLKFGLNTLAFKAHLEKNRLNLENIDLKLAKGTSLQPEISEINLVNPLENIDLRLFNGRIYPDDFVAVIPDLSIIAGSPIDVNADISKNGNRLDISTLELDSKWLTLKSDDVSGTANDAGVHIDNLNVRCGARVALLANLLSKLSPTLHDLERLGDTSINVNLASLDFSGRALNISNGNINLGCEAGKFDVNIGHFAFDSSNLSTLRFGDIDLTADINLSSLSDKIPLGILSLSANGDGELRNGDFLGELNVDIEKAEVNGHTLSDIRFYASKDENCGEIELASGQQYADLDITGNATFAPKSWMPRTLVLDSDFRDFKPAEWGIKLPEQFADYSLRGKINANISDFSLSNPEGTINASNLKFGPIDDIDGIELGFLQVDAVPGKINLDCDYLSAYIESSDDDVDIQDIVPTVEMLLARTGLVPEPAGRPNLDQEYRFEVLLKVDNRLTNMLNLPFRLLTEIPLHGTLDGRNMTATLKTDIPYLQQSIDKLIKGTSIEVILDEDGGRLFAKTTLPTQNDASPIDLALKGSIFRGEFKTDLNWDLNKKEAFDGSLSLDGVIPGTSLLDHGFNLNIRPSQFHINGSKWQVSDASVNFIKDKIDVHGLKVWHGDQFVNIDGVASKYDTDTVYVKLNNVNLDYIFNTLNINFVTFGGNASGVAKATALFSGNPVAFTDGLKVNDFSYNHSVLGEALLKSRYLHNEKEVAISAEIRNKENNKWLATVDGGIWVTRDSMSFDFDTDHLNISLLQPFLQTFTSKVEGEATGKMKVYGTFEEVDLAGKMRVDTISIKVDPTNVTYYGSGYVEMSPGRIEIKPLRVYDRFGNYGTVAGRVDHHFLQNVNLDFRFTDCHNLLGYDVPASSDMMWYGTVFVNGNGVLTGNDFYTNLDLDIESTAGSQFSVVLDEHLEAVEYDFLTFTDKKKTKFEALEAMQDTVPDFEKLFRKRVKRQIAEVAPAVFILNMNLSVGPDTKIIMVMDPVAGDKITANGKGSMSIGYRSDNDEFEMFGKYILDEGKYNFTLQDIIIRDFIIRRGSSISFNGDPTKAYLDIEALYRVNTNLSDLDKSFSTDRDLNRTNVPVDAVLKLTGPVDNPSIDFDIELPTLTSDVTRKVKSIISTEDMMSRQILYLLALNRFYTPEYMNTEANASGAELTSVASSTISAQLGSLLGQISDKWSVAPSFRSDKGDFSDIEFDVALSSRLLNNRLLLNGNFGYRDRASSSTTFIGDFDLEYLLNSAGNFRLKAYNHFNDQNYYLRSALTTQGIGIIFRQDFNSPFRSKSKNVLNQEDYHQPMEENPKQNPE